VNCDLIISGGTVLTMEPDSAPLADGAVAVRDGEIVAVGPAKALLADAKPAAVLDAGGGLIMPGLVNTHTHLAMALMRGFADDLPLKSWLEDHIWPAERELMDADTVALGTRLAAAESLREGVTCVADMYFFVDRVAAETASAGLRAVVSEPLLDFPTPSSESIDESLARTRDVLTAYRDHRTVVPAVGPHAPYTLSPANLARAAELSDDFSSPLLIHLSETRWEVDSIRKERGATPVGYLAELGVLSERTVAVHCVHVDYDDLGALGEFDVGISCTLVSNLKLASGVPPLHQFLARGLKVGFGTDGSASNNSLDVLRDAQLAALLFKGLTGDPTVLPARRLVELLTIGGARVLGLGDRIGTLVPGKRADVICVAVSEPHTVPMFDPFSHLAYAARAADVRHSVVDGRIVMRDRELLTIDGERLVAEARAAAARIGVRRSRKASL
jgi:5-methylthioadenosine/S-adenosylhomocysteine deaminase